MLIAKLSQHHLIAHLLNMKVLMVIPSFHPIIGGAEQQLRSLSTHLVKQGIDLTIVTRHIKNTSRFEEHKGVKIIRLSNFLPNYGFLGSLFWFILRNKNLYHVIHVHTLNSPAILCSFLGKALKIPVLIKVTRSGQGSQLENLVDSKLRMTLFKRIGLQSFFVAITSDVRNALISLGISKARIHDIPNGVNAISKQLMHSEKYTGKEVRIIYVGRLIKRKRVDLLIQTILNIKEQVSDYTIYLDIIGDGPEKKYLQIISKSSSKILFKFHGALDQKDVNEKLMQSDIFVLPSESEGMSNALLEAMANGLAVIASSIPGNQALIKTGYNGRLFTTNLELEESLIDLINNIDLRNKYSKNAYHLIQNKYSFEMISKLYLNLYKELI